MKNSGRGGGILAELGVTPVINGGGPNTMHSGSRPLPEVVEAMEAMAPVFVQMDEWLIAAGREIAQLDRRPRGHRNERSVGRARCPDGRRNFERRSGVDRATAPHRGFA